MNSSRVWAFAIEPGPNTTDGTPPAAVREACVP
jgi:hypothetical protein